VTSPVQSSQIRQNGVCFIVKTANSYLSPRSGRGDYELMPGQEGANGLGGWS
jgi:hypothetical protein